MHYICWYAGCSYWKAKTEGEARGEAKGKAESICQFLEARFGKESQALQEAVLAMKDLDTLIRMSKRIFTSNSIDEAKSIVQGSLVS